MNWITVLGLAAAACTTISFLPQAIKTVKSRRAKDISIGTYSILTIGVFLWLLYGILIKDTPIIIANAITLLFTSTILSLIIKHK